MFASNTNTFGVLANEDGMSSDPDITVTGEDAEEVETENFGFVALNGDTKVKLFPDTFPESSIPVSSASLFTIANKRGLFAAGGPSTFILGTNESLRNTFTTAPSGSTIVNYSPTVSIPLPTPISHIVFDSSENHLILGATSGGLAIYATENLGSSNNQASPLFEVGTNGLALREVKPNPNLASPEYVAVVTQNGDLRILSLASKKFTTGAGGEVLKTGISTISWSQRGKQLVCGLTDGSCSQITPDGVERAAIPKPPGLTDHYVSHITWLENNLFLIALTPIPSNPQEPNNDSIFYIFSRTSNTEGFRFQKLPDPTPPFGMTSRQAYHFCGEIKHWLPHLQDALILANTSSADIGLLTRFSNAVGNVPEGTFTVSSIANDSRRAALPLGEQDMTDTSPIGLALDVSSRDKVSRPIAGEEPEETGPLPILMVLNNESLVSAWHIVYSDAVRNNSEYPQLAMVTEKTAPQTTQRSEAPIVSAFAAPATPFRAASLDVKPFGALGTSGTTPAFGQPAYAAPAFAQPAASPSRPAFGQPAFGRPAFGQAAFGQSGWGTTAPASPTPAVAPAFASSTFGSNTTTTPAASTFGAGSGFGKFASAGGFASMAASTAAGSGPAWAKGLGSGTTSTSPFGGLGSTSDNTSSFGGLSSGGSGGIFGSSAVPLKIPSTFQADTTSSMSAVPESKGGLFGGFGSSLGGALGGDKTPSASDADMDAESPRVATPVDKEEDMESTPSEPSSPPPSRPAALAAPVSGSFGNFGKSQPVSAFTSTASSIESPASQDYPAEPLPPSPTAEGKSTPEGAKIPPGTDAPLPPDLVPKLDKEAVPEVPLLPVPGDKPNEEAAKAKDQNEQKEAPKNVFGSNMGSLGSFGSLGSQKPSPGLFSSAANDQSPFANAAGGSPFGKPAEGSVFGKPVPISAFGKPSTLGGAFGSSAKPPITGIFSQPKPGSPAFGGKPVSTPPSTAPTSKSTPGIFGSEKPTPASPSPPPLKSAFQTTTQPLPPLGDGGPFGASQAPLDKEQKSVFDSPPAELTGGIFAGYSKKKPVKSEKEKDKVEIKPSLSSRASAPPGTKSALGKKSEVGKKSEQTRAKPTSVNPMHRFGMGKTRPALRPSPLSRRQQEDEEERNEEDDEDEEDEEVEDQEEEEDEDDYEEVESEPEEEEEKPKPKPKSSFGDWKPQAELPAIQPKSAFGDPRSKQNVPSLPSTPPPSQLRATMPQALPRASTPAPPPRASTPAPPPPPPEYEDERIWKILQSEIPVEPNPAAPVFNLNDKIVEASPDDGYEAIYDKAYESCNVMVNSIGMLARNLEAYVSAHQQCPDLNKHTKHQPQHQLKQVEEWRLCEIGSVRYIMEKAGQMNAIMAKGGEGLDEMINDLTKGVLRLQSKVSEIQRLKRVIDDPKGAAAAQSRYLPPEQALQQRELRNKLATVQYELEEGEKAVTMLKATVAARDRGKSGGKIRPPTVEAVKNTILKLTAMIEKKNSDVEYTGELLRKLRAKQALGEASMYEEPTFMRSTMLVVGTPARGKNGEPDEGGVAVKETPRVRRGGWGLQSDELDMEEAREEIAARREMGSKLRKAMKLAGTRVTNVA